MCDILSANTIKSSVIVARSGAILGRFSVMRDTSVGNRVKVTVFRDLWTFIEGLLLNSEVCGCFIEELLLNNSEICGFWWGCCLWIAATCVGDLARRRAIFQVKWGKLSVNRDVEGSSLLCHIRVLYQFHGIYCLPASYRNPSLNRPWNHESVTPEVWAVPPTTPTQAGVKF